MENKNKHQISKTNSKNLVSTIRKISFLRIKNLFQPEIHTNKLNLSFLEQKNKLETSAFQIESERLKGEGLIYLQTSPIR
jgi:hypothetical protein